MSFLHDRKHQWYLWYHYIVPAGKVTFPVPTAVTYLTTTYIFQSIKCKLQYQLNLEWLRLTTSTSSSPHCIPQAAISTYSLPVLLHSISIQSASASGDALWGLLRP